jgi:hypothetical protein
MSEQRDSATLPIVAWQAMGARGPYGEFSIGKKIGPCRPLADHAAAMELIRTLEAECARLREDARRWEWIRDEAVWRCGPDDSGDMVWAVIGPDAYNLTPIDGDQLDAAVDARLAALKEGTA